MALEDLLVAICPAGGVVPVGAGLRLQHDLVLTCSHVVNEALGRPQEEPRRPSRDVKVSVKPHSPATPQVLAWVDTEAKAWSAPPAESRLGADLCLLRLESGGSATPAVQLRDLRDVSLPVPFRAAGFPENWDVDPALGVIVLRDAYGLYILRPDPVAHALVSLLTKKTFFRGEQRPPGIIHKGFSGGPVEVEGAIVGLVTTARSAVAEATAYMIPVSSFPEGIAPDGDTSVTGRFAELTEGFVAPETINLLKQDFGPEAVLDAIDRLWSGLDAVRRGRLCHAAGLLDSRRARQFLIRVRDDPGEHAYVCYMAQDALTKAALKGERR